MHLDTIVSMVFVYDRVINLHNSVLVHLLEKNNNHEIKNLQILFLPMDTKSASSGEPTTFNIKLICSI
jgi:hypothetical protein